MIEKSGQVRFKGILQSINQVIWNTTRSQANQNIQPLSLKKHDVEVEQLDLNPRPTEKIECDVCELAYPEQLRTQFKHFKTTEHASICIKCYSEKYKQLLQG